MSCKIADSSQAAEPFAWRTIASGGGAGAPPAGTPGQQLQMSGRRSDKSAHRGAAATSRSGGSDIDSNAQSRELEDVREREVAAAHHSGLQEGLRQGREDSAQEVEKTLDQLAYTIEELAKIKKKLRNEAEHEIVKLSLAVARRILYRELTTDPDSISGVVHAALQKLQQREVSRVRVYPAAAAAVRAALERTGGRAAIEVIPDSALETGSMLFETAVGELDASVETQLQEIQRGFTDRLAIR